jgi:hypothetical protein
MHPTVTIMAMQSTAFSNNYHDARQRFRQAALRLGWQLETHSIDAIGPGGEQLAFDVGSSPEGDPERVLVVSSGIHGVEGFFGSAVQIALLEHWTGSQVCVSAWAEPIWFREAAAVRRKQR